MSEYWKSTPRYWCKYCSVYVRDTKLERQNHDATGRHQSAIKRSLRELHRGHEREEREKERAKREVDRLNGVVSASGHSASVAAGGQRAGAYGPAAATGARTSEEERQRQLEQLAGLGVAIPDELRSNMAMAGEWTVTNTRVIDDPDEVDGRNPQGNEKVGAAAKGVRKREHDKTEEEQEAEREEEKAVGNLFKKQRRWGRDTKSLPGEGDAELEALLSGDLGVKKTQKEETDGVDGAKEVKEKTAVLGQDAISEPPITIPALVKEELSEAQDIMAGLDGKAQATAGAAVLPDGIVFKKRKAKDIRQK